MKIVCTISVLLFLLATPRHGNAAPVSTISIARGDVTAASVQKNQDNNSSNNAFLNLTLTPKKQAEIAKLTAANIGKKIRVLVSGKLLMEPTVNEQLNNRTISLTVDTLEHAQNMAKRLLKTSQ